MFKQQIYVIYLKMLIHANLFYPIIGKQIKTDYVIFDIFAPYI